VKCYVNILICNDFFFNPTALFTLLERRSVAGIKVIHYRRDWLQADDQDYIPGWDQDFSVHHQIQTNCEVQLKANYPPERRAVYKQN
jgi:hypothetical protein